MSSLNELKRLDRDLARTLETVRTDLRAKYEVAELARDNGGRYLLLEAIVARATVLTAIATIEAQQGG